LDPYAGVISRILRLRFFFNPTQLPSYKFRQPPSRGLQCIAGRPVMQAQVLVLFIISKSLQAYARASKQILLVGNQLHKQIIDSKFIMHIGQRWRVNQSKNQVVFKWNNQ